MKQSCGLHGGSGAFLGWAGLPVVTYVLCQECFILGLLTSPCMFPCMRDARAASSARSVASIFNSAQFHAGSVEGSGAERRVPAGAGARGQRWGWARGRRRCRGPGGAGGSAQKWRRGKAWRGTEPLPSRGVRRVRLTRHGCWHCRLQRRTRPLWKTTVLPSVMCVFVNASNKTANRNQLGGWLLF